MDASLHIQSTQVLPNRSMGFSAFDLDYWLMPNRFISLTGASDPFDQIDRRLINNAADAAKRQNLVECLLQQYATIGSSEPVLACWVAPVSGYTRLQPPLPYAGSSAYSIRPCILYPYTFVALRITILKKSTTFMSLKTSWNGSKAPERP
jgi:hypothetical protein